MSLSLPALQQMSARLGSNLDLIQAGGGNTSVKLNATLWVKASGKWLIQAADPDTFLPVPLDDIRGAVDNDEEYTTEHNGLRPSVETAMHAVIPHGCVIHVHSVNVLAWAARADAPASFSARLKGLRWVWIPYIHPGLPLAQRIAESLAAEPDVILMQNHGLIVGGETCDRAEALLHEVERRLELPMRDVPPADLDALSAGENWQPAEDEEVHGLGTDPASLAIASGGTLYPDHCVYLGHSLAVRRKGESTADAVRRYTEAWDREPAVLACESAGVLTAPSLSRAGRELLICLARTVRRIPEGVRVHYLEHWQVAKLMNWDAEHYRQAIARRMEEQRGS